MPKVDFLIFSFFPFFAIFKIEHTPCTFPPLAAKLIKIESWGLFHWKAECLLIKMGSFGASRDLHYGREVGPFQAKGNFLNNLFGSLGSNFQAIYGTSKIGPYGQI